MKTQDFQEVLAQLREGKPVAYPTETFYALGCDASNPAAIDQLMAYKDRSTTHKPFPVLIGALDQLSDWVAPPSALAQSLIDKYWPGPLTLILQAKAGLDPRVCNPEGGIAIRWTSAPLAQKLSASLGQAMISTSANLPGGSPPDTADAVLAAWPDASPATLDGGQTPGGVPSTILDLHGKTIVMLRKGPIHEDTW